MDLNDLNPYQRRVLDDITKVLVNGSSSWAIVVIGFGDHHWNYGLVEMPMMKYEQIEDNAARIIRRNLQKHKIYPSFVKLKSSTADKVYIQRFESEENILIKIPIGIS